MRFHITDIVEISALRELFEGFSNLTGIVSAVLDLDGNVLISTAWQDICVEYHRVHPETSRRCRESDTVVAGRLRKGDSYNVYRCKNGLIDVAVPIIVGGVHVGNLFTGQFFFSPPDSEYFRRQAAEFDFDEDGYLEALSRVPILSEEHIRKTMGFLCQAAAVIGEIGLTRLDLLKTNRELEKHLVAVKSELARAARYTFNDIIGESKAIRSVVRKAEKIADSPSTVLILGESGTGKEMFAHAIHKASDRCDGPFVAINCAAIPKDLIQSELFGYEPGAFTGARRDGRAGKFEVAHGGTLFLDEIGNMPLEMQSNLLRVIEERAVVRVGGSRVIPVDVRLIAATHCDLLSEAEKGQFRRDLYYRLSVIPLTLPPLRDRLEDVIPLAEHHARRLDIKLRKRISGINRDVLNALEAYTWPGNVRELVNVLEQAVIMAPGSVIAIEHIPQSVCGPRPTQQAPEILVHPRAEDASLAALEKVAIERAILRYRGNVTRAAKTLGIGRNTLYEKLKKYDIEMVRH